MSNRRKKAAEATRNLRKKAADVAERLELAGMAGSMRL
jgi:hypothetical protein